MKRLFDLSDPLKCVVFVLLLLIRLMRLLSEALSRRLKLLSNLRIIVLVFLLLVLELERNRLLHLLMAIFVGRYNLVRWVGGLVLRWRICLTYLIYSLRMIGLLLLLLRRRNLVLLRCNLVILLSRLMRLLVVFMDLLVLLRFLLGAL